MAKFNKESSGKVENYMGGVSFKQTPKDELIFAVLTSFIESSYYEGKDKRVSSITELVQKVAKSDPEFIAKLAIYTRTVFNMRSSSHVLFSELAKVHKGDSLVRKALIKGITRVDDITEIISYLGKPIPNSVKKGLASALLKFNEYQIAKYRAENKDVSLVDVFNLIHPKPNQKTKDTWQKLMKGELKQTETWEAMKSAGKETWKELLKTNKLGYMALLRNLRNIIKESNKETIKIALDKISDKENVLKSKQLPFRFLSAYIEIEKMKTDTGIAFEDEDKTEIIDATLIALTNAILYSVENIPLLRGRTLILSDNSGSMRGDSGGESLISAMSKRKTSDIANLFAVLYWTRAESTLIGLFGNELIIPKLDRSLSVFENYKIIDKEAGKCGPNTEEGIFTMFEKLIAEKKKVDRIVIFSDMQVGEGCEWYDRGGRHGNDFNKLFQKYHSLFPDSIVYSVDLKGYGNALLQGKVIKLAGWHNEIFRIMELMETDKNALIKEIEKIEI